MPVPTTASLIAPDNRLLGWGLTDVTLYGAQPEPGLTIRPADQAAVADPAAPPVPADDVAATAPGAEPRLPYGGPSADDSATARSFAADAPAALHAPAAPAGEAAASVPPPVGSGTAVQPLVETPLQAAVGHAIASPGAPAPAEAGGEAAGLAHALTAAPLASAPALAAAAPPLGDVVTAAGPTAQATVDTVGAVAHGAGDTLAELASGLVETLTGASAAAPPIPTVAEGIEGGGVAAAGLVGDATDAIAHATTTVGEATGLDGLSGSDPAGGVATLVDMVSTADTFALSHAAAPEAEAAPSILDALAADEAPPALLGDHAHDATDAAHAVDPHGIHLGL